MLPKNMQGMRTHFQFTQDKFNTVVDIQEIEDTGLVPESSCTEVSVWKSHKKNGRVSNFAE